MASGAAPVLLTVTGSGRERRAGSGGVIPDLVGFLKVGVTPPAKPDSFPFPPLSRYELTRTDYKIHSAQKSGSEILAANDSQLKGCVCIASSRLKVSAHMIHLTCGCVRLL